jgi:hypothetical protein
MRLFSVAVLPSPTEFQKQDQSGILAQILLLCGNLRLEFFREFLFSTRLHRPVK